MRRLMMLFHLVFIYGWLPHLALAQQQASRPPIIDVHLHALFDTHDFMLLLFEVRPERDDWGQLTAIAEPFHEAVDALGEGQKEQAETHFRRAIVAAIKAPELTKVDRRRVVDLLSTDFKEAKANLGFSALVDDSAGYNLQKRMNTGSMSFDQAKALGEPTLDEFV